VFFVTFHFSFLSVGFVGLGTSFASFADSSSNASTHSSEFACTSSVPPPTEDKPQDSELEQHPAHLPTCPPVLALFTHETHEMK